VKFHQFFQNVKTIAVVGLSDKPERYSYQVAKYLQSQGFRIIPVNPQVKKVLGEKAYPDLLSIPQTIQIDVIDIFRRSELVLGHVEFIRSGCKRALKTRKLQSLQEPTACGSS